MLFWSTAREGEDEEEEEEKEEEEVEVEGQLEIMMLFSVWGSDCHRVLTIVYYII